MKEIRRESKNKPVIYDFAKEFTEYPGFRYRTISEHSGEEFREEVLEKYYEDGIPLVINVEGTKVSLGSSFLTEAFAVFANKIGLDNFKKMVSIDTSTPKGKIHQEKMMERVEYLHSLLTKN